MKPIRINDTTVKCPICYVEYEMMQGEDLGYCKKCETEFEEVAISEKALKFITDEIKRLKYAPKLNGCEMQPEWAEQLEIFEYFLELIKKDESDRGKKQ